MLAVSVPATSANMGSGFDTVGVALEWRNIFHFDAPRIPTALALPSDSLAHQAAVRLFEKVGEKPRALNIQSEARIPFSRGLGSSSTAVIGGLVGANALIGSPLDAEALLAIAIEIEGHPDNVAPALFGGFQIAVREDNGTITRVAVEPPDGLSAVVCIPECLVPTEEARAALPAAWSREETVANLGRVAVLMTALLSRRWELLRVGMDDRLHQPYRAPLVPGFHAAVENAIAAGAYGAALSGSGSAILALVSGNEAAIGEAMCAAVRDAGEKAQWTALALAREGARVL
ncbi:MAG: homoserine kinase [Armatimonas sp.]